jgi:NTF2-related export protein 1/2
MPTSLFYDIQCIDTQIINPRYYVPKDGEPSAGDLGIRPEKNISILVLVAGGLRMENERKGPLSEFSETFLLVPNLEKRGGKVTDKKGRREWLVESQVTRFVVVYGEGESEGLVSMDVE